MAIHASTRVRGVGAGGAVHPDAMAGEGLTASIVCGLRECEGETSRVQAQFQRMNHTMLFYPGELGNRPGRRLCTSGCVQGSSVQRSHDAPGCRRWRQSRVIGGATVGELAISLQSTGGEEVAQDGLNNHCLECAGSSQNRGRNRRARCGMVRLQRASQGDGPHVVLAVVWV